MSTQQNGQEKMAGTNLTPIAEYTQTALALADLTQRYSGVVFEIETPKGLKEAKQAVAELRTYRTDLEKMRTELKAPVLERGRLLDSEAKRITEQLRALEDPIKAQVDAREAEIEAEKIRKAQAEQARVDGHRAAIQKMRDFPLSLQGRPAQVIEGRISDFKEQFLMPFEQYEEFCQEAMDAYDAAFAKAREVLQIQRDHEAEQEKIRQERAELERMRAENERLQREVQERAEADARRVREEAEAKARAEQAERDLIDAQERAERERVEAEQRAAREAEEAAERQRLEEEARRQREAAAELERQKREHAAQVERDRIAKLGLMEAVKAVVEHFRGKPQAMNPGCLFDLIAVYDALPQEKREAAKPVRKPRTQA